MILLLIHLFQIGDCAYIQEDKDQFPNEYIVRKIVDIVHDEYIYQYRTEVTKYLLQQHQEFKYFERDNVKMKCPKWFK